MEFSWKYVSTQSDGSEEIVAQSSKWFLSRSGCRTNASKAMKTFVQRQGTPPPKRVIVKRIKPYHLTDERDQSECTLRLEHWLTMAYALQLTKLVLKLSKQLCFGCVLEDSDIDTHDCHNIGCEDTTQRYLVLAWNDLDEVNVLTQWRCYTQNDRVLQGVQELVFLKYECKDYRKTVFKTEQWKNELAKMVNRLVKLERVFV
jgi:hypothetical protein